MDISKCISDICGFPVIYYRKNKAPLKILEDCGYLELHADIGTDKILEYLERNPELIDKWLQYSEDIRWSPAWSLGPGQNNTWTVAYYDRKGLVETRSFDKKIEACSSMIKMTIEEIRK